MNTLDYENILKCPICSKVYGINTKRSVLATQNQSICPQCRQWAIDNNKKSPLAMFDSTLRKYRVDIQQAVL